MHIHTSIDQSTSFLPFFLSLSFFFVSRSGIRLLWCTHKPTMEVGGFIKRFPWAHGDTGHVLYLWATGKKPFASSSTLEFGFYKCMHPIPICPSIRFSSFTHTWMWVQVWMELFSLVPSRRLLTWDKWMWRGSIFARRRTRTHVLEESRHEWMTTKVHGPIVGTSHQWSGRTGSWLQMNRPSLRNDRLKFKTARKLPIVLEEFIEYSPI